MQIAWTRKIKYFDALMNHLICVGKTNTDDILGKDFNINVATKPKIEK